MGGGGELASVYIRLRLRPSARWASKCMPQVGVSFF